MKLLFVTVGIFLCIAGCDKADKSLIVKNNSDHDIVILASNYFHDSQNYGFSDCSDVVYDGTYYHPNKNRPYSIIGTSWENYLRKLPENTLRLYIFNVDTAKAYYDNGNCDKLKGQEAKYVDVTMDYLNNNNFTITYP